MLLETYPLWGSRVDIRRTIYHLRHMLKYGEGGTRVHTCRFYEYDYGLFRVIAPFLPFIHTSPLWGMPHFSQFEYKPETRSRFSCIIFVFNFSLSM